MYKTDRVGLLPSWPERVNHGYVSAGRRAVVTERVKWTGNKGTGRAAGPTSMLSVHLGTLRTPRLGDSVKRVLGCGGFASAFSLTGTPKTQVSQNLDQGWSS